MTRSSDYPICGRPHFSPLYITTSIWELWPCRGSSSSPIPCAHVSAEAPSLSYLQDCVLQHGPKSVKLCRERVQAPKLAHGFVQHNNHNGHSKRWQAIDEGLIKKDAKRQGKLYGIRTVVL